MTATIASPEPAVGPAPPRPAELARAHPVVPGLASGLLLFFAFPPADRWYLAWFALVPLLLLVRSEKPRRSIYLGALAGGLAFWLLSVIWIWELHPDAWVAWLALAGYQAVYWPLFLLLARLMVRRFRLPLTLAAPIAWVGLEYVQAYALSGFPWYYLAHSQYRLLPLIQISDFCGAWGVSFLVMLGNAWLADLLSLPIFRQARRHGAIPTIGLVGRTAFVVLMLSGTLGYGVYCLKTSSFRPGPRVALLQSNIAQEMKVQADSESILAIYEGLIQQALNTGRESAQPLDLIVWPETSFPEGYVSIGDKARPRDIDRSARRLDPESRGENWFAKRARTRAILMSIAASAGTPMIVGSILYDLTDSDARRSNAALLVDPAAGSIDLYRKMHLVPFGEYVPLLEVFPWVSRLTPYDQDHLPMLTPGERAGWTLRRPCDFAPLICFEDTIPHVVREFFLGEDAVTNPPQVLVTISNDGWFRGSAEHDIHLAIGVFRAVEHRVPMVRAVNGGVSAVIDGNGRILRQLPKQTAGTIVATVPLDDRRGLYTLWGDFLGQGCFAVSLGLGVLGAAMWPFRRRRVAASVAMVDG